MQQIQINAGAFILNFEGNITFSNNRNYNNIYNKGVFLYIENCNLNSSNDQNFVNGLIFSDSIIMLNNQRKLNCNSYI